MLTVTTTMVNFYEATPASKTSARISNPYEFLVQHRIFLSPIGRDQPAFGTVRFLLTSLADVAEAAQKAFEEAGTLHRDISVGNIKIIRGNGGSDSGHLTDWDHCLLPGSEGLDSHRGERAGTWQFMSVYLLRHPDGFPVQSLADSIESLFWILYYISLRYLVNDLSASQLYDELAKTFDHVQVDKLGRYIGGDNKRTTFLRLYAIRNRLHFTVAGVGDIFVELARVLDVRYATPCTDDMITNYNKMVAELGPNFEYLRDHPYAQQQQSLSLLASPAWIQDTLRKHAQTIPLPSNPDSSSSETAYDYHLNQITYRPIRHFIRFDGLIMYHLPGRSSIYYPSILNF